MVMEIVGSSPFTLDMYDNKTYTYPTEARGIGWLLALSSVLMIPIVAVVTVASKKGSLWQVRT